MKVNVHSYIIPGLVDEAVVKQQAERRFVRYGERTMIHYHQDEQDCVPKCFVFEPKEES